jgi:hypothetical protein
MKIRKKNFEHPYIYFWLTYLNHVQNYGDFKYYLEICSIFGDFLKKKIINDFASEKILNLAPETNN